MATIYYHEIHAYRMEVEDIQARMSAIIKADATLNITQASLAVSNRCSLIVIGLCSLIEARLLEQAITIDSVMKLDDIKGQGITKLKLFLSRHKKVDFGSLPSWRQFLPVYKLRNAIVHSYGGMILESDHEKLRVELSKIGLQNILVGGYRIRVTTEALHEILNIADSLLEELDSYIETEQDVSANPLHASRSGDC
jgi:hypothetical protein